MAVRLLVGPPGSGKTSRALERFKQFTPPEHQHSVRFIVPTVTHAIELRRLILSDPVFPGFFGDPICTLQRLASDILTAAGMRPRLVSDLERRLILREIVLGSSSGYFDRVRDAPGFPDALGSAIGALRSAAITPEDLSHAVESCQGRLPENSKRKILDLAALYRAYAEALKEKGLSDRDSLILEAVDAARNDPELVQSLICAIFDGFSDFSPVCRQLIRLLAEHSGEVLVALDYEAGRPEVFSSIEPILAFLMGLPGADEERTACDGAASALCGLRHRLFSSKPAELVPDSSVVLLSAAGPRMEIELVAGEIRKLIREGLDFGEIAVIARDTGRYQQRLASVFREYGIPPAVCYLPVMTSSIGRGILNACRAGALRSPSDVERLAAGFDWSASGGLREECAAWRAVRRITAEIAAIGEVTPLFDKLLEAEIQNRVYRFGEEGGVSFLDVNRLSGRKFRAVFLIGMSDRSFPRTGEDPFLLDWERQALNSHLPCPLSLRSADAALERYRFYTAVSSASEYLYLSYSGDLPSPYVGEVDGLFGGRVRRIVRAPRYVAPTFEQAETAKALVERTVLDCCHAADEESQSRAAAAYNLLLEAGRLGPDDFRRLGEDEEERILDDA